MCKKQTSVSHSSTEAEVIALNAGLRMDGIPAVDLWDLVIEVIQSSPNQTRPKMIEIPTMHTNLDPTNVDHVPFQCYVVCLWG